MKLYNNALLCCLLTVPLCASDPEVSGKLFPAKDNVSLIRQDDRSPPSSHVIDAHHDAIGEKEKNRKYLRERDLSIAAEEAIGSDVDESATQGIVGGNVVEDLSMYPFFVNGGGCGGIMVTNDVVITAAHCNGVFWKNARVGPQKRTKKKKRGMAEWVNIASRMHVHPHFSWTTMQNDFMIFKVTPVKNKTLRRALHEHKVTLNFDPAIPAADEWLTTIGVGATSEGGPYSASLREVGLQYMPHEECNAMYGGTVHEQTQLCAAVDGGGKDACQGDSGGPILAAGNRLVGIVSWGYGCARPEYPGVYSRLSGAEAWIKRTICKLTDTSPDYCS